MRANGLKKSLSPNKNCLMPRNVKAHFKYLACLRHQLLLVLWDKIKDRKDPSHDFCHTLRVLMAAEKIAQAEGGDLEVVIPSAIFHDVIVYSKNSRNSHLSQMHSSQFAARVLSKLKTYPRHKITAVQTSIEECSFSKAKRASSLESRVLQDADLLESVGAISIMRTFASAGVLNKVLFEQSDPFCANRKADDLKYALDLFFTRLLLVPFRLNTKTAKRLAKSRIKFLRLFLKQLQHELRQLK